MKNRKKVTAYGKRNKILRRCGWSNYSAYLNSDTWKRIRAAKLRLDPECESCGGPANQVHHTVYSMPNLLGHTLDGLWSICGRCHFKTEFKGAEKRSLGDAKKRFLSLRRWEKGRRKRAIQINRELDAQMAEAMQRECRKVEP